MVNTLQKGMIDHCTIKGMIRPEHSLIRNVASGWKQIHTIRWHITPKNISRVDGPGPNEHVNLVALLFWRRHFPRDQQRHAEQDVQMALDLLLEDAD